MKTLPEFCLDVLSKEIDLERVPGFEDIESVQLASGNREGASKSTEEKM